MGWGCTVAAGDSLDAVKALMRSRGAQMGNGLCDAKGVEWGFFDLGQEQEDGSITGTVLKYVGGRFVRGPDDRCPPVREGGRLKIAADGEILRWPGLSKAERAECSQQLRTVRGVGSGGLR